ncbi:expressed unknown protein [Seminavis robusta]|uniref:Uncharacterized protein n=1 Tax=Seminavis robusta TaxID=568900 RepID=A0A9N8E602_9STRA|nr:expressed unknown protein [Seminavis robusta]|eukprot:Sro552_g165000.1 n/a (254) ;mRNA; f:7428-8189
MTEEPTSTSTPARRVQFSDAGPAILEYELDEITKGDIWLSKELCHKNKEKCQRLGKTWQRRGYDVLLDASYQNPVKHIQSRLDSFVSLGEDCVPRGIERFISAKHADERRYTKLRCVESVVDLGVYMRRQNSSIEEIESELRDLSVEHSRPSRHFARRIAIADAKVVQEEMLPVVLLLDEERDYDDDDLTVTTTRTDLSSTSTHSDSSFTSKKGMKGLSYRAKKGTKRITRMITGRSKRQQESILIANWPVTA